MIYVALLRGINVGGNNKISMQHLKQIFESAGMQHVATYINSGNVIFESPLSDKQKIVDNIEKEVEAACGFRVAILLVEGPVITALNHALPKTWTNDDAMKSDVIFLWQGIDKPQIIEQLPIKEGIDTVIYRPGAILWGMDRQNATKSGLYKLIGTDLYKQMTVRNCNTLRKLANLVADRQS